MKLEDWLDLIGTVLMIGIVAAVVYGVLMLGGHAWRAWR